MGFVWFVKVIVSLSVYSASSVEHRSDKSGVQSADRVLVANRCNRRAGTTLSRNVVPYL